MKRKRKKLEKLEVRVIRLPKPLQDLLDKKGIEEIRVGYLPIKKMINDLKKRGYTGVFLEAENKSLVFELKKHKITVPKDVMFWEDEGGVYDIRSMHGLEELKQELKGKTMVYVGKDRAYFIRFV